MMHTRLDASFVTGEGHKTRSVFRRRLSRVEFRGTVVLVFKTLELRVVLKLR